MTCQQFFRRSTVSSQSPGETIRVSVIIGRCVYGFRWPPRFVHGFPVAHAVRLITGSAGERDGFFDRWLVRVLHNGYNHRCFLVIENDFATPNLRRYTPPAAAGRRKYDRGREKESEREWIVSEISSGRLRRNRDNVTLDKV